ncbi:hypothetical protein ACIHCQ_24325 [Streptomyces sp. NPDC052236]|uniref:hypothetical protein n=1 Tax=Streptomyces sp. NPDC052236 TaxID=3365686 RepID=UPI0037D63FBF
MRCGRERLPAEAPAAPPALPLPPPPPLSPPLPPAPPGAPSPVGAFLGRALRGDWLAPAKAAVWPAGLLLGLAVVLAIPSYGQDDEDVVGWSDRLRIALAMLLQGLGGGFEATAAEVSPPVFGDGGYPDSSGSGSGSDSGLDAVAQGSVSLSVVPLTVTLLSIAALYLGARWLRTRGEPAGPEAAVRISVLVAGAVLVLGLFAQPEIEGMEISSSPLLAALGALALSLVVTAGVLQRDRLAAWLALRPAARSAMRALRTAVGALGAVVVLCSLVGFIVYANADDVDGTAMLIALPVLPNIGFAVLGLSWGVPVEYDVEGPYGATGSGSEHDSFGLAEIGDVWGDGAVAGALALGVVCALTLGVVAARRSADRREQVLAGGMSLGLILLFTAVSGVSAELDGGIADWGGQGTSGFAPSVPDALLFGLLWVGAATFLGPYVLRMAGQRAAAPAVASAPFAPTMPVYAPEAPTPYQATVVSTAATAPTTERRRKVLVWAATLTAAFVIGGGATAGTLILTGNSDESDRTQNQSPSEPPAASESPSPSPSESPSASPSPTPTPTPAGGATLPAGFVLKQDPAGFTVGVPAGWQRRQAGSQIFYEAPTGGSYLQIGVIKNTPMSSYENFLGLEKKHLATPETEYTRLLLTQNTFQGRPGALWEFTHVPEPEEGGVRRHVIDQAFVAPNGTEYAILAADRAELWDTEKDVVFSTAINTFKVN